MWGQPEMDCTAPNFLPRSALPGPLLSPAPQITPLKWLFWAKALPIRFPGKKGRLPRDSHCSQLSGGNQGLKGKETEHLACGGQVGAGGGVGSGQQCETQGWP